MAQASEKKILTNEAAKLMGKDGLFVREAMRRGLLNIGVAMQMPGRKKWTFSISPSMLAEYMGIDVATLNERLVEMRASEKL